MTTTEFRHQLKTYPDHTLVFELPDGDRVPVQAHVTEVGRVDKTFLDCGATQRTISTCQLQAWVDANDTDHRLKPGKLANVLDLAAPLFGDEDMPVEIEYEDCALSQYPIVDSRAADGELVFILSEKHSDCLAPEFCGVSSARKPGAGCCC